MKYFLDLVYLLAESELSEWSELFEVERQGAGNSLNLDNRTPQL